MSKRLKSKYDFIQEVLESKNLSLAQRERVLLLVKREIKKEGDIGRELEDRVKKIEESILGLKDGKTNEGNIRQLVSQKSDRRKKRNKIKHNPEQTFEILKSFKFNDAKYGFKYLVHGNSIDGIEDYKEKIETARKEFRKLKDVPYKLYKSLDSLILAYELYGEEIVKSENKHPFESDKEIKIKSEDQRDKLRHLFGGGKPYRKKYFRTFRTAIQDFKRKYRFDLESSESSILSQFLENITKYEKHTDGDITYSFSNSDTKALFNETQLNFDLSKKHFFLWNPALNKFLKWIISSILKHSNIDGNRPFDPEQKQIIFSSYEDYDEGKGKEYIVLEITDTKSVIKKGKNEFIKSVLDEVSVMASVCDVEVYFIEEESGKAFYCSLLPKGKITPVPSEKEKEGVLYRFKILKD